MKRFSLEALIYTLTSIGFCVFIASLQGCDAPQPIPTSEHRLPAEKNFEPPEKIWTEEDFRQAEAHPADINYYQLCQTACPDNLTADDLAQIEKHHRTQMQKLTAGVTQ